MTTPSTPRPEPLTPAAQDRPRDPRTGRVLLPIKAEVCFLGRLGPVRREFFADWAEAASWAAGIAQADQRVKSVVIVHRHPDPSPETTRNRLPRLAATSPPAEAA